MIGESPTRIPTKSRWAVHPSPIAQGFPCALYMCSLPSMENSPRVRNPWRVVTATVRRVQAQPLYGQGNDWRVSDSDSYQEPMGCAPIPHSARVSLCSLYVQLTVHGKLS